VIVTDCIGVRDHLTPGVHALVVLPGDPAALRGAIEWMLAPANRAARDAMARAGQQLAEQMTFAHYAAHLCNVLKEIQAQLPMKTGSLASR
jgi:glycosyltransferase involved in cell wall biosynthesis